MPNLSNSSNSLNTVTFLFAGDGSLASDGLCAFLQTKTNFLLLSECSDGASAVANIESQHPEIAVVDAKLSDMDARQIIEAVRTNNRDTKIIVLGASADRNIADELLSAGADAYVVRNGPSRHLNEAIRYVRDGGKYLAPQLTRDAPVSATGTSNENHGEAVSSLRAAVEAQALTVARLEHAMDRTQYAIELLQQKVEQLTGGSIEPPPSPLPGSGERRGKRPGVKTGMSAVAATLVLSVLGFLSAGILRPASGRGAVQSSVSAAGDPSPANSSSSLTGREFDNIEHARVLLSKQQYVAAEGLCRMVLKRNPSNTMALRILASALFHEDRVSESADVISSMAVPPDRAVRRP